MKNTTIKKEDNKLTYTLISIIGIVAIVGIVALFLANIGPKQIYLTLPAMESVEDLSGYVTSSASKYYGSLLVTSTPSGASIYVNNYYKGVTPLNLSLMGGYYVINITKSGYNNFVGSNIEVKPSQTKNIDTILTPKVTEKMSILTVTSQPSGATLKVTNMNNGAILYSGKTPASVSKISSNMKINVAINMTGYKNYTASGVTTNGADKTINVVLQKK